jgi:hypothetical protein
VAKSLLTLAVFRRPDLNWCRKRAPNFRLAVLPTISKAIYSLMLVAAAVSAYLSLCAPSASAVWGCVWGCCERTD